MRVDLSHGCRGVAQFGSAPALGAGGRWFKSIHPDHIKEILMVDINDTWRDFGATVHYKQYQLLSASEEAAGLVATIVIASTDVWEPGHDCPDGYRFADYSTVLATSGNPTTRKDKSGLFKDDKVAAREVYGEDNEWHQGVRGDFNKAPTTNYDTRKVFINRAWNFNDQLESIKKGKPLRRIRKSDRGSGPDWLEKAYGRL